VNSSERPQDRYEDYVVKDLIVDAENKFPIAAGRSTRAIVGISMGGFGAVNLSLRHPDLFAFVGALSPAIDVPSRPFSIKRVGQWRAHSTIFGPWGSQTRRANDPFVLVHSADSAKVPYFFLSCGEQEGLLAANGNLQRRSRLMVFTLNSILARVGTTGISGTGTCLIFSGASSNTALCPPATEINSHLGRVLVEFHRGIQSWPVPFLHQHIALTISPFHIRLDCLWARAGEEFAPHPATNKQFHAIAS
jgi:pimeloyl-ACP methyl ester carboxylesterase